jgi:hypothetical protein
MVLTNAHTCQHLITFVFSKQLWDGDGHACPSRPERLKDQAQLWSKLTKIPNCTPFER